MNNQEHQAPVQMVGVFKPEYFDIDDPQNWFVSFEANLRIHNVQKELRYDYLLCALNAKARAPIAHQLDATPDHPEQQYDWLKELLISGHTKSRKEKLQQLLQGERIGDRKPTQFLAHLRQLAPESMDDELVREFWWKELSPTARAILSAVDKANTRQLAEAADSVYAELTERLRVEAVRPSNSEKGHPDSTVERRLVEMTEILAGLTTEVRKLITATQERSSRSRSRDPQKRPTSRARSSSPRTTQLCFYHQRYKDKARSCKEPCSFPKN